MDHHIKTYRYPNGEIQRVQVVRWEGWEKLDFFRPAPSSDALDRFAGIYRDFLVPAAPWLFGSMLLFRLPAELNTFIPRETRAYGTVADPLTAAAAALQDGVRIFGGKPVFRSRQIREFWEALAQRDCLRLVRGKLPTTTVIPVGPNAGYLTGSRPEAALKVNASFFIMDRFDCATVFDHVGTPLGLCVKDGIICNPPLYGREALLVDRSGSVTVRNLDIRDLSIEINGQVFSPGKNATVFTRPGHSRVPSGCGPALVIVGNRVEAIGRNLPVPASGFVLVPRGSCRVSPGDSVQYRGLESVSFGIQVGNSILRDGAPTEGFLSRFYNIRRLEPVPYPPSLYPLNYAGDRAARIALGADPAGKPILLWAEGKAKFGYVPGESSRGASLSEMIGLCRDAGMHNAVNLDGGGSAQILLKNRRCLAISDRNAGDHLEAERPIPLGLLVDC